MNIKDAANLLEALLDRITGPITDDEKLRIRDELLEFKRSLPFEPEFAELRRIADDAFDDLGRSVNQSVLTRMRGRGRELSKYIETISAVTDRAEKDAKALRLTLVRSVTAASRELAETIRSIKSSIEANDLEAATRDSERALANILNLIHEVSREA